MNSALNSAHLSPDASWTATVTVSAWLPFEYTRYYEAEMGGPLERRLLAFRRLVAQDRLAEIKVATGYELDGKVLDNVPTDISRLGDCKPIYRSFEGWKSSTVGITSYAELPLKAREFVGFICRELGCLCFENYGCRSDSL